MRQQGRSLKKFQVKRHLPFSNILHIGGNFRGLGLDPEEHVWGLYEGWPHPVFWNLVILYTLALLYLVLCNPVECNPPGSSVHGDFQVRILESGAYSSGKEYTCKQKMQESWVWSLRGEVPLKEEMATHSSILAWRIPRTEEPGELQSMGSERDRTKTTENTCRHIQVTSLFLCCVYADVEI